MRKEIQFQDVMDIYAFRIIMTNIDLCYRVLGPWPLQPQARPLQRLHCYSQNQRLSIFTYVLIGPHGVPISQIRTHDMNKMADEGVAAHWLYKNGESNQSNTTSQVRAQKWMQTLLELQQSAGSTFNSLKMLKVISSRRDYILHLMDVF